MPHRHALRQLSPEASHLTSAVASLAQAAAALLATPEPRARQRDDVKHIALDEEWPADG